MPDIIVMGGDYNPQDVVGAHIAKVVIIPLFKDISTSEIIRRIKNGNG
jgi:bifunctional ADP-heptose synthase (sugar kinase/adenylyltransferase)